MALLILFGFIAGAATALSPCVLPVLPIALSAGATGGRRRPLGIVAGLAVSFTFATVALVYVISALGLPNDFLRKLAIVVLLGFGIVLMIAAARGPARGLDQPLRQPRRGRPPGRRRLLVGDGDRRQPRPRLRALRRADPRRRDHRLRLAVLQRRPAGGGPQLRDRLRRRPLLPDARRAPGRGAARSPRRRPADRDGGGDGPRRPGDAAATTTSASRTRSPATCRASSSTRRKASRTRRQPRPRWPASAAPRPTASAPARPASRSRAGAGPAAPTCRSSARRRNSSATSSWFNTPGDRPLTLKGLRGRVVLVDFWTYSCINCLRTLPYLKAWDARYRRDGLTIVGVHTPEFPFEREASNVENAIAENGIRYPVVQDNEQATWNAYGNQYWPAEYFVDAQGNVRYVHFGEGEYGEKEKVIRELLAEAGRKVAGGDAHVHAIAPSAGVTTPETYLGPERAERFTNPMLSPGLHDFSAPAALPPNEFAYHGRWRIALQSATAAGGSLDLNFGARRVYLVMGSPGRDRRMRVALDGRPISGADAGSDVHAGVLTVSAQRLYNLVDLPRVGHHVLTLKPEAGVMGYAFTFG